MGLPDLVVVSNRGPLSFDTDDGGNLLPRRGGGGLASSLGAVVAGTGAKWVATAITEADREAARRGVVEAEGFRVRSVVIEPDVYRRYYDVIANSTLWFLHHHLFDLPRRPRIDRYWHEAWETFREVNRSLAEITAEEADEGATVLVHDYHLPLVGTNLARLRPDLATVHFLHTPFADPSALGVLPDDVRSELLSAMAVHRACGFHTRRWAGAFEAACRDGLGRVPRTFVSPAVPNLDEARETATSAECAAEVARLDDLVADRALIARVDRIELSKNVLRGLLAFDELLRDKPRWRERVVFASYVYPSREGLADYLAYRAEIEALVELLNNRWSTSSWTPVLLDTSDSYVRSVAALRRFDVLLVNPVRDGLNLVCMEGTAVNDRDGVLLLSREAGAWDVLGSASVGLNPFDVTGTAKAFDSALGTGADERRRSASERLALVQRRSPQDWLDDQLAAARTPVA